MSTGGAARARTAGARTAFVLASIAIAACGRHEPQSLLRRGKAALDAGDPRAAVAAFERALRDFPREDPGRASASLGRCHALADLDGAAALDAFVQHRRAFPAMVDEVSVEQMALRLLNAGPARASIDLLAAASAHIPAAHLRSVAEPLVERLKQLPAAPRSRMLCGGVE